MPFEPREASARSVALRQARAKVKAELASGERDFLDTFDEAKDSPDSAIQGLRLEWFLRALPGVGPTKAAQILEQLGINPRATIGGLRVNQRSAFRRELIQLATRYAKSQAPGHLVVIAGPTAVGKDTVIRAVRERNPDIVMSISATTRSARPGEVDGRDYFFVTNDDFDQMVNRGELLEWAMVHGRHRYGTPRRQVEELVRQGKTVFLEIDVQGARQIRESGIDALFVFIAPPTFEALAERLALRGTEDDGERQRRLASAVAELSARNEFDVVVINDRVEVAAQEVLDLVQAYTRGE